MKVILYSKTFWPQMGGLERNTFTIYNTLKCLGHKVTIITETKSDKTDDLNIVRTKRRNTLIKLLKNNDILIVNGGIALKIILFAYFLRKKYIVIYQNATLYNQNPNKTPKAIIENKIRHFFAEKALINICLTRVSMNQLQVNNKRKFVLYNPIDIELEKVNQKWKTNDIGNKTIDCLYVGRMIKGKGIYLLVDALEKLALKGAKFSCTFAGEGRDFLDFQDYCKKRISDISFVGKVDGSELIKLYHQSKVLILPSTSHIEGNPLVIAEAISCGIPIICSNQEAMKEAIGDCGLTFETGNVDDLTSKIELLLKDPILYGKMHHNTIKHREFFSMKTYSKNWKEILKFMGQYCED